MAIRYNGGDQATIDTHNMIWNTVTMAWEAATGSLAGGGNVTVNNFPAIYPVSDNGSSITVDGTVSVSGVATEATLLKLVGLAPTEHDTIELSYTGTDLTGVVYKLLGATVATLTLTYDAPGGNLITVVKT